MTYLRRSPVYLFAARFGFLAAFSLSLCQATCCEATSPIMLAPQIEPGAVDRVEIEIEVGGKLTAPRIVPGAEAKADTVAMTDSPLRVVGELAYEQRLLPGTKESPLRSARYYDNANVAITTGAQRTRPELTDEHRLIVCDHNDDGVRMWSPRGSLLTSEANLIDIAGNTLFCEQLLPVDGVEIGGTWKHSAGDIMTLVGLDNVTSCIASSTLKEANERYARIELTADIAGTVDGAETSQTINGIYLFDTKRGRITQLNLAIKESRKIGPVSPGFDGVAKLNIRIEPRTVASELSDEIVAKIPELPKPELLQLTTENTKLGVRFTHSRDWFVTADTGNTLTLRHIDAEGLVANCNIARAKPGRIEADSTIKTMQADVRSSIGAGFKQFTGETQWITPEGYRTLGLNAIGEVTGVPVEWHSYLLADDKGRRVSLSFTLEASAAKRLGGGDRAIVDSVQIIEKSVASESQAASRR